MFKIASVILCAFTCTLFAQPNTNRLAQFLKEYPSGYQDVLLRNKVVAEGKFWKNEHKS
jgi:hypothetical protein